jgi:hypothetical protein
MGVLDFFFLSLVGLSFYFLFAARTGESIPPPWNLVSSWFFVCLILATTVLLIKIWRGKSPSSLLLFYIILLILIPACGLLILMHHPYDMKNAGDLERDWMITNFGRFVVNPTHPEAATSPFHKTFLETGQYMGDTFLINLLQISPLEFALFFVPILSTLMVVFASFDLMHSLAPEQKALAPLCSLSFLATQHNIFLFTPPGKNETFALGLLMVSAMLWVRLLQGQRIRRVSFTAPILLSITIFLVHEYVGLFALFLATSALSVYLLKPFQGSLRRLLSWLGLIIGLIFIWIYVYPNLVPFANYLTGGSAGGLGDIQYFSMSKFIGTVVPPLRFKEGLGVLQSIFYGFVNNSVYVTYALIILGVVAAFRYRLKNNFLAISVPSIALAFGYFGVVGNFHVFPETYRFFYYFNFLAFPLMGVGLYWLASHTVELKVWIHTKSKRKERGISFKPLQLAICGLLLASLFTSSIWAGYPRPDTMGPYGYPSWALWYPSDYDFAALNFIKAREGDAPYKDFFIVGDHPTSAAGILALGNQVVSTDEGYQSIFTFFIGRFGYDEFFNLAAYDPVRYLVEGTEYTNRLTNRTYLVFTYRLLDRLESVVNIYSEYLGKPIFSVEDKVYVFSYNREQIAALLGEGTEEGLMLFDDEQVKDGFWLTESSGTGNLDITINDNYDVKKRGNSSLEIVSTEGKHSYVALSHTWEDPVDFSEGKYLAFFVYGHYSGLKFHITFWSTYRDDYFSYEVEDNFEGWRLLLISLKDFEVGGTPSWSAIKGMLVQFWDDKWSSGNELYLDQISVVKKLSLQQLYHESVIILPQK